MDPHLMFHSGEMSRAYHDNRDSFEKMLHDIDVGSRIEMKLKQVEFEPETGA